MCRGRLEMPEEKGAWVDFFVGLGREGEAGGDCYCR